MLRDLALIQALASYVGLPDKYILGFLSLLARSREQGSYAAGRTKYMDAAVTQALDACAASAADAGRAAAAANRAGTGVGRVANRAGAAGGASGGGGAGAATSVAGAVRTTANADKQKQRELEHELHIQQKLCQRQEMYKTGCAQQLNAQCIFIKRRLEEFSYSPPDPKILRCEECRKHIHAMADREECEECAKRRKAIFTRLQCEECRKSIIEDICSLATAVHIGHLNTFINLQRFLKHILRRHQILEKRLKLLQERSDSSRERARAAEGADELTGIEREVMITDLAFTGQLYPHLEPAGQLQIRNEEVKQLSPLASDFPAEQRTLLTSEAEDRKVLEKFAQNAQSRTGPILLHLRMKQLVAITHLAKYLKQETNLLLLAQLAEHPEEAVKKFVEASALSSAHSSPEEQGTAETIPRTSARIQRALPESAREQQPVSQEAQASVSAAFRSSPFTNQGFKGFVGIFWKRLELDLEGLMHIVQLVSHLKLRDSEKVPLSRVLSTEEPLPSHGSQRTVNGFYPPRAPSLFFRWLSPKPLKDNSFFFHPRIVAFSAREGELDYDYYHIRFDAQVTPDTSRDYTFLAYMPVVISSCTIGAHPVVPRYGQCFPLANSRLIELCSNWSPQAEEGETTLSTKTGLQVSGQISQQGMEPGGSVGVNFSLESSQERTVKDMKIFPNMRPHKVEWLFVLPRPHSLRERGNDCARSTTCPACQWIWRVQRNVGEASGLYTSRPAVELDAEAGPRRGESLFFNIAFYAEVGFKEVLSVPMIQQTLESRECFLKVIDGQQDGTIISVAVPHKVPPGRTTKVTITQSKSEDKEKDKDKGGKKKKKD